MAKCLFCHVVDVEQKKWNRPCSDCVKKKSKAKVSVNLVKPLVAAILTDDEGHNIFVDKFGVEVSSHDYDLENDPRGYKSAGLIGNERTII